MEITYPSIYELLYDLKGKIKHSYISWLFTENRIQEHVQKYK